MSPVVMPATLKAANPLFSFEDNKLDLKEGDSTLESAS